MITVDRMVLIGAARRDNGKTVLAEDIISRFCSAVPVAALKISVCQGVCPRGDDGCGACSSFDGAFALSEEIQREGPKDTARMLKAGAQQVFWLRAKPYGIFDGFRQFLSQIDENSLIVCESNSLREFVKPGCFIMLTGGTGSVKSSSEKFASFADVKTASPEGLAERLVLMQENGLAVSI